MVSLRNAMENIHGVPVDEVRELAATYASISDPTIRLRVRDFVTVLAQTSLAKPSASASLLAGSRSN